MQIPRFYSRLTKLKSLTWGPGICTFDELPILQTSIQNDLSFYFLNCFLLLFLLTLLPSPPPLLSSLPYLVWVSWFCNSLTAWLALFHTPLIPPLYSAKNATLGEPAFSALATQANFPGSNLSCSLDSFWQFLGCYSVPIVSFLMT